jgi:hypothetical protein
VVAPVTPAAAAVVDASLKSSAAKKLQPAPLPQLTSTVQWLEDPIHVRVIGWWSFWGQVVALTQRLVLRTCVSSCDSSQRWWHVPQRIGGNGKKVRVTRHNKVILTIRLSWYTLGWERSQLHPAQRISLQHFQGFHAAPLCTLLICAFLHSHSLVSKQLDI